MKKVKVLVADDSAFMRKLIQDILLASNQIEIVGIARNGEDAVKKVKELKPDVVTMDIEMPVLNGIDALKMIMNETPVPVVMLSSTTMEGAENTFLAIQNGAVDFIAKPSGTISLDLKKVSAEIVEKVISASKANLSGFSGRASKEKNLFPSVLLKCSTIELYYKFNSQKDLREWESSSKKLICIGSSTGGPRALQTVLTNLPGDIKAPILIVQHMPAGFTKSLANRLHSLSQIAVKEAEHDEILKNGTAYIAPGGYHLMVKKENNHLIAILDQSEPRNGHRPSVDLLFESAGFIADYAKIAVIMTGMGTDGSKGLIEMNRTGKMKAIAESEDTAIVYGMPKAAVLTNLVDEIQNLEDIANAIMKYV